MNTIGLTPEMEAFQKQYPCSQCGAVPVEISTQAVEEFRMAPRDDEGRAMLYMPYEFGTTVGMRWETTAICEQGHAYFIEEKIKMFDDPKQGPPLL